MQPQTLTIPESTDVAELKTPDDCAAKLGELGGQIDGLTATTIGWGNLAVQAAWNAGTVLNRAKALVKDAKGLWLDWLNAEVPNISERTARNWMALAKRQTFADLLEEQSLCDAYKKTGILPDTEGREGTKPEPPPFKFSFAVNGDPAAWEPVKQKEIFVKSRPFLETMERLGFITIKGAA